jgi:hypothetical protein
MVVIDDHHLLAVLAGSASVDLASAQARGELFTTFGWYYRLACALSSDRAGALSAAFSALPDDVRDEVVAVVEDLRGVGILPPEVIVPVAAELHRSGHTHNQLNTEALAACLVLDATMVVAAVGARTRVIAAAVGVEVMVRPPLP